MMLLLCTLVAGSGTIWAKDYTTVLTLDCATPAPTGSTSTSLAASGVATFLNSAAGLSSAKNKITCTEKTGDVYSGKGSGGGSIPQQCLKIGKASGGGSFTFNIPETYDKIDAVELTCYGWKTSSSISINSGSAKTFTTAQVVTTKTFELASSSRTITIAVTASAVCVTQIVLKKESVSSAVATTTTIDASGITNTNKFVGTAAGSLSASVTYGSPAAAVPAASVTWSGDNDEVATINASTGAVTLVGAGTVTFTASYAGVTDTYQSSSDTYEMTVTNVDPNAPGSENNPYTVAQARAAIDAETGVTGVYATGIVSEIVTEYSSTYHNISYNISADGLTTSDQLQAFRGKSFNVDNFTSADGIQVGDVVVIYGDLTKYKTTYEFGEANQLVSLNRKINITDAGFATFASDHAMNFDGITGLKAYKATVSGTDITFTKVTTVPAGEGVLLQGDAGTYNVPATTGVAAWTAEDNAFVRGTGAAVETGTGPYNYILNKVGDVVGFYKAAGQTVATNRAYLQSETAAARISLNFDDEETNGISATLMNSEERIVKSIYNLAGQRVAQPTKGLYIKNGRKVIVK